jgi:hypothetical protein
MSIYMHSDFERIATAIGTAVEPVVNLKAQFEAAFLWFRLDKRRPRRPAPSKQREKLTQVAKSARRLLKSLGINDPDEAADGPGDRQIFEALVLIGERDASPVLEADAANWSLGAARRIHCCSSRVRSPSTDGCQRGC